MTSRSFHTSRTTKGTKSTKNESFAFFPFFVSFVFGFTVRAPFPSQREDFRPDFFCAEGIRVERAKFHTA
jgi:hypothetical protein